MLINERMVARSGWRVAVSFALAGVLVVSSLAALPVGRRSQTCERESHPCAKIVAADCCCQPAAPPAASVTAEVWSSAGKLQWHSLSWIVDVAGWAVAFDLDPQAGVSTARSSPPLLGHPEFLPPLLI